MPQASGWNDPMVLRAILEYSFSTWMNVGTTSHEELLGDIGYDYGLLGMNDPVPERVVEQTFFLVADFMDDIKMTEHSKEDLIEKYVAKGQRTVTANKKKSTAMRKEAIEPAFHEDLMRGSQMLEDFLRLLRKSHDRLIEAGEEFGNVQHFDGALNDISERLDAAEQATQMLLDRIDQEFDY